MTFKPQVYLPNITAKRQEQIYKLPEGKLATMNDLFTFPLAMDILNLVCLYSKLERQQGCVTVQYPVWKADLEQDHLLQDCFKEHKNAFAVIIHVEIIEIVDVMVEVVQVGERVGAFTENYLEELKE